MSHFDKFIEIYCDKSFKLREDTYLVQENGQVREDIFVSDGLHLNAKGYDIWGDVVRAALTVNESLYEEFSMGTNYYTTTSELISDCVTVKNNSAEQRSLFSLSFKLVGPTLVLSNLYPRDQKAENCSDELNVSSDLAGSVVSAEFRTSKKPSLVFSSLSIVFHNLSL